MCQSFEMCVELSLLFILFETTEAAREGQIFRTESRLKKEGQSKTQGSDRNQSG